MTASSTCLPFAHSAISRPAFSCLSISSPQIEIDPICTAKAFTDGCY